MKRWDVFISHASEDKATVLTLKAQLQRAGLRVWLDSHELKLGDSLSEKIDEGLRESRFGVLLISPKFLLKYWTRQELNGLIALEEDGHKVVLPIWHEVSKQQVKSYSPILADRIAANTNTGLDQVTKDIVAVVMSTGSDSPSGGRPTIVQEFVDLMNRNSEPSVIADFIAFRSTLLQGLGDEVRTNVLWDNRLIPLLICRYDNAFCDLTLVGFGLVSGPSIQEPVSRWKDVFSAYNELSSAISMLCSKHLDDYSRYSHAVSPYLIPDDSIRLHIKVVARRRKDLSKEDRQFIRDVDTWKCSVRIGSRDHHFTLDVATYDTFAEELARAERDSWGLSWAWRDTKYGDR